MYRIYRIDQDKSLPAVPGPANRSHAYHGMPGFGMIAARPTILIRAPRGKDTRLAWLLSDWVQEWSMAWAMAW